MNYFDSWGLQVLVFAIAAAFDDLVELIPLTPVPNHLEVGGADYPHTVLKLSAPDSRSNSKPAVLITFGHHGRELVNPNIAFHLMVGLLHAYQSGSGWTIGTDRYSSGLLWPPQKASDPTGEFPLSHAEVHEILEQLDIVIVPNLNPNGRDKYISQPTARDINEEAPKEYLGRKNQRPVPAAELAGLAPPQETGSVEPGVDLNRNHWFLHSIEVKGGTSRFHLNSQFCGPFAESEVETQNIVKVMNDFPNLVCVIDVHSYADGRTRSYEDENGNTQTVKIDDSGGWIIHPWGHALTIHNDRSMTSFPTSPFDENSHLPDEPPWTEYLDQARRRRFDRIAQKAIQASDAASGDPYIRVADAELIYGAGPVTGEFIESAFAREFAYGSERIDGWVLETGRGFWVKPGGEDYAKHVNGALAVLLSIAREYI